MNDCTPEQDEQIREFCRHNDVGKMKKCPKCPFKAAEYLHRFCQHKYCPMREWRHEQERPEREAREAAEVERRERAELDRLKEKYEPKPETKHSS